MNDHELREFTRVPTAFKTTMRWSGGSCQGMTHDVSLNGAFVLCPTPPPPGTAGVAVVLTLEDDVRIAGHGTVVRVQPTGCALRFDELDGVESYEHLRRVVLYNSHEPDRVQQEISSHLGLKRIDPAAPPPA
jgi:hypothetical protein